MRTAATLFARLPPTARVVVLFVGLVLPQALLGLPIAAAAIGPLPALAVLVVAGAAMTVAAAAEAEALARDDDFRRAGGYFGKLVARWLGPRAAAVPTALAGLRTSLSVLASYVGLSVTLAALTGLPRVLWGVAALAALSALLVRGGLRIPAELGALLGLACLPLLAAIGIIAVAHGGGSLGAVDGFSGDALGGLIGLVVMLYIANVYVVSIAREAIGEGGWDPDGRALVRGSALGTIALTAIAAAWLLASSAALAPEQLTGEAGTVLGPLAAETGAVVTVLGTALTLLLLGLGMERTSVAVMSLVAERVTGDRRLLPVLAPLAVCLVGEGLLAADAVSFSAVFGVSGVATNVVLALALPLLLLLAARREGGAAPGATIGPFGGPGAVMVAVLGAAVLLAGFATVLSDGVLRSVVAVAALVALAAVVVLARGRAGACAGRAASAA